MYSSSSPLMVMNQQPKIYANLHSTTLLIFSIFNIILWVVSSLLMVSILVPFTGMVFFASGFDPVGHGLWAGLFYGITGFLGYSASYRKTKPLLVACIVFSSLSVASGLVAATLSGMNGSSSPIYECGYNFTCAFIGSSFPYYACDYYYTDICDVWISLQWSLFAFSLLAIIFNIVVTSIASAGLFQKPKTLTAPNTSGNNQGVVVMPQMVPAQQSFQQYQMLPVTTQQQQQHVQSMQQLGESMQQLGESMQQLGESTLQQF